MTDIKPQKYPQEWRTKLVGVTFENRQELIKEYVRQGQRLFFKHNKNNPYDENAIEVYTDISGTKMIGHINKKMAKHMVERIREGITHTVFCENVTGGEDIGRSLGVNIRIVARK